MPKLRIDGQCFLIWAILLLTVPLPWLAAVSAAAIVHEAGHYFAVRLLGGQVRSLSIHPSGAVMEATELSGGGKILTSLAGPLAGLLLLILAERFPLMALCALVQSIRNLLPLGGTDGTHILRTILTAKIGERRADRICLTTANWLRAAVFAAFAIPVLAAGAYRMLLIPVFLLSCGMVRKIPCKTRPHRVK